MLSDVIMRVATATSLSTNIVQLSEQKHSQIFGSKQEAKLKQPPRMTGKSYSSEELGSISYLP
uniref:Uncharacterized protein n=1 Tax=Anguilla anguilla TaxID=7936 RepID=A0A0E9RGU8_ANGAN